MSLLVVGALHWDVVVRAPRMPGLDETLRGEGVTYQFGGKGGNQAIAAAKAGARVAFAGRVGRDDAGAAMRALLVADGVDVAQLQTGDGASGMSAAIVTADGSYGAVIVAAENYSFDPSAIKIPQTCRMMLLQNEMKAGVLRAVARLARAGGVRVVLNAAPAIGIEAADLALVDTLIVNKVEAADLLKRDDIESDTDGAVESLKNLAPHASILLTLGRGGASFAEPGEPVCHQPALPVDVHSTHGAGDVFVGTYAAIMLRGGSMAEAVEAGQRAAAAHIFQSR